jgi:hypothetical protein
MKLFVFKKEQQMPGELANGTSFFLTTRFNALSIKSKKRVSIN